MTDFQKRAKEAAERIRNWQSVLDAISDARTEDQDMRFRREAEISAFYVLQQVGPTALTALRAVAGGQEAWQRPDGLAKPTMGIASGFHLRPVLIVEEPNE